MFFYRPHRELALFKPVYAIGDQLIKPNECNRFSSAMSAKMLKRFDNINGAAHRDMFKQQCKSIYVFSY